MKFAIIGYGKMGHAVESAALRRNHQIVCTIDNPSELEARLPQLRQADVAIEFSTPSTAAENIRFCLEAGIAIVCGTTGWYDRFDELAALCREKNGTLFTATNFSIGMNIMFALNERLAELMRGRDDYAVSISETHHIHKLDAPSGTGAGAHHLLPRGRGARHPHRMLRQRHRHHNADPRGPQPRGTGTRSAACRRMGGRQERHIHDERHTEIDIYG